MIFDYLTIIIFFDKNLIIVEDIYLSMLDDHLLFIYMISAFPCTFYMHVCPFLPSGQN